MSRGALGTILSMGPPPLPDEARLDRERSDGHPHVMPPTLILVPTDPERRLLEPALSEGMHPGDRLELCGFGPVAAAARAARLLVTHPPARVLLVGIAGRFDDRLALGAAYRFARVACHGVGAGTGDAFLPAASLGWRQWPGGDGDAGTSVGDEIDCGARGDPDATGLLLSACAASATAADVAMRMRLFPAAVAEDMEGFAVALACRLAGVPLDIVRGISNDAGDRDKARWRLPTALGAAADLAVRLLGEPPIDVS
ncbi:MAG: futalosine hydrolase [Planctomycetia bacterium]|nr:futalosine hydrolase [Planctomycetia bacterium]